MPGTNLEAKLNTWYHAMSSQHLTAPIFFNKWADAVQLYLDQSKPDALWTLFIALVKSTFSAAGQTACMEAASSIPEESSDRWLNARVDAVRSSISGNRSAGDEFVDWSR